MTHNTQFEWPLNVCNGVWVLQSHIRAVESPAPEHIRLESLGTNAQHKIVDPCPAIAAFERVIGLTLKWPLGYILMLRNLQLF